MRAQLKDGFEVEIRDEALDDWEFLEMLDEVDSGGGSVVKVAKTLLGEEGVQDLKQHFKETIGRASVQAMIGALTELMESAAALKN